MITSLCINIYFQGETALHLACLKNYSDLVRKLVNLGANPNLLSSELRQSALHYATKSNSEDCIRAFIDCNAENETSGKYAII